LLLKTSPLTDVAIEVGFAGTAEFSRTFRNHVDRTASSWDRRSPLEKSKICKEPETLSFYALEGPSSQAAKSPNPSSTSCARLATSFNHESLTRHDQYGITQAARASLAAPTWPEVL
jgi:hypothetical protein